MPRKKKSEFSNNISQFQKNKSILYDNIHEENLSFHSYASAFGGLLSEHKHCAKYRLFQSRATNANYLKDKHVWQGLPHALLICDAYIPHPHCRENIVYSVTKSIIHPGPILRIKQMINGYPQIVATHTQHKYVFVWNTATQHNRQMADNSDPNTPQLILKGHKKDAVYALDFSHTDYGVASGGKDNKVCVWNIGDYNSVLSSEDEPDKKERFVPLSKPSPKLKPRCILKGHSGEVSDVEFAPYSPYLVASVSYDKSLKIWDLRCNGADIYDDTSVPNNSTHEIQNNCVASVDDLHSAEITNFSWNAFDTNHLLTASKDGETKLLDMRNLSNDGAKHKVINTFVGHTKRVSSLQWNPSQINKNYFLSASHDGTAIIWNANGKDNSIVFKHVGHTDRNQGPEVIHGASWVHSDNSWSIVSTSSSKPFAPFFWSSSSNKASNGKTNQKKKDEDGKIMNIWTPNSMLKMNKKDILHHLKQERGAKFIDDLTEPQDDDVNMTDATV